MRFLLPIDGSPHALAAAHHLIALSRAGLAVEAVLVNVQEPPSLYEVVTAHDVEVLRHVRSDAGADLLAAAETLLSAASVPWQSEVAGGQPATLLVELLENYGCDAVVIGARGLSDAQAGGIGQVAQAVLAHSPVPVTVVRDPADDGDINSEDASD